MSERIQRLRAPVFGSFQRLRIPRTGPSIFVVERPGEFGLRFFEEIEGRRKANFRRGIKECRTVGDDFSPFGEPFKTFAGAVACWPLTLAEEAKDAARRDKFWIGANAQERVVTRAADFAASAVFDSGNSEDPDIAKMLLVAVFRPAKQRALSQWFTGECLRHQFGFKVRTSSEVSIALPGLEGDFVFEAHQFVQSAE